MTRGEVWWINFDPSLGGEIQKTRPAIIVSNDASNRHLNRVQHEAKAERAEETIAGGGVISVQVLNEFASVARRKLGMTWVEIRDISAHIRTVCTVGLITLEVHDRGLQLAEDHGFSVYDAMIVAAALLTGCATLYSEDMQDGQVIDGRLTIRNPFLG